MTSNKATRLYDGPTGVIDSYFDRVDYVDTEAACPGCEYEFTGRSFVPPLTKRTEFRCPKCHERFTVNCKKTNFSSPSDRHPGVDGSPPKDPTRRWNMELHQPETGAPSSDDELEEFPQVDDDEPEDAMIEDIEPDDTHPDATTGKGSTRSGSREKVGTVQARITDVDADSGEDATGTTITEDTTGMDAPDPLLDEQRLVCEFCGRELRSVAGRKLHEKSCAERQ